MAEVELGGGAGVAGEEREDGDAKVAARHGCGRFGVVEEGDEGLRVCGMESSVEGVASAG
jgi:hypothetical protein